MPLFTSAQLADGQRQLRSDATLLASQREEIHMKMRCLAWAVSLDAAQADGEAVVRACMEHASMVCLMRAYYETDTGNTVEAARAFAQRGRRGEMGAFEAAEMLYQDAVKSARDRAQKGQIRHEHELLLAEMMAVGLASAGMQRAMHHIDRGEFSAAVPCYEHSARLGNPQAMHKLSFLLAETAVVPIEPGVSGESLQWCERACKLGHPHALNVRANALNAAGEEDEAQRLYTLAVSRGSLDAICALAQNGDFQSTESQKQLWRVVAAGFHPELNPSFVKACLMLAGSEASSNPVKAQLLLCRAAACGDDDLETLQIVHGFLQDTAPLAKCCCFCSSTPSNLLVCTRCKVAKYCSAECQRSAWRAGHRHECGKRPWPERELLDGAQQTVALLNPLVLPVVAGIGFPLLAPNAIDSASQSRSSTSLQEDAVTSQREVEGDARAGPAPEPSDALREQKALLAADPSFDYFLKDFPDDNHNSGVSFNNPLGRCHFKLLFGAAEAGDLFALGQMYDFLVAHFEDDREKLEAIRKQLEHEFGVDPVSHQVQNAPSTKYKYSEDEMRHAMCSLSVTKDVATALSHPALLDMSATQLLAACRAAHEQRVAVKGTEYEPPFKTPAIGSVTNTELKRLKPLYLQLLNDVTTNDELFDIISNLAPNGAAAALYVLEIPVLVEQTRMDSSGLSGATNLEPFPLRDIKMRIFKDRRLLPWCRLVVQESSAHSEPVLASVIQLLTSACEQDGGRGKRTLKTILLLLGSEDSAPAKDAALVALFDELGEVLRKTTLHAGTVVNACQLLTKAVAFIDTPYGAQSLYALRESITFWLAALNRVRPQVGNDMYQMYLEWLTPTPGYCAPTSPGLKTRQLGVETRCDNAGCDQQGVLLCSQCKGVRYCGPACQRLHWKAVHKYSCKK